MIFRKKNTSFDLTRTIEDCKKGQPKAQKLLYERFAEFGKNICMRYANSEFEAEEILSDGFIKVFSKINDYRGEQKFEAWFRRIVVNTAIDYYRKNKNTLNFYNLDTAEETFNAQETNHYPLDAEEIMNLVQSLSPAYRIVFSMSVVDGYTHTEIAKELQCTESAVRANLTKAKAKLKEKINQYLLIDSKY
ncbi:RpoE DNA-directed RNA polymerase specialized sigma subunit, sigma24 homolog [Spirosomataceae bacterium]